MSVGLLLPRSNWQLDGVFLISEPLANAGPLHDLHVSIREGSAKRIGVMRADEKDGIAGIEPRDDRLEAGFHR